MDINKAFRAALLEDVAIAAAVGTRVYWPRLPGGVDGWKPDKGTAIVFAVRGGYNHEEIKQLVTPSYKLQVWSSTSAKARAVYQLVHNRMHTATNLVTAEGKFRSIQEESYGQDVIDPDTNWPTVVTFYNALLVN